VGEAPLRKTFAFEIFITGVIIFDALGWEWKHLPVWPFLPMWVGAMVEIEVGARIMSWLSKRVHLRLSRGTKGPLLLSDQ
jgi:hypothetical protein